jgi:hypothetical protein
MRTLTERREATLALLRRGALDGNLTLLDFAAGVHFAYRARSDRDLMAVEAAMPLRPDISLPDQPGGGR